MMPGPLSSTTMRKRVSSNWMSSTFTSGKTRASSQASRALSTASFTAVRRALRGLSNPNKCRFFSKNSAMEISRCFLASSSALLTIMNWEGREIFLNVMVCVALVRNEGSINSRSTGLRVILHHSEAS